MPCFSQVRQHFGYSVSNKFIFPRYVATSDKRYYRFTKLVSVSTNSLDTFHYVIAFRLPLPAQHHFLTRVTFKQSFQILQYFSRIECVLLLFTNPHTDSNSIFKKTSNSTSFHTKSHK